MKLRFVMTFALLVSAPGLAAPAPRPVTLAEAVAMAQRNAPAIVQARGQARTSAAGVRSATAAFLPSISVSAGATRQIPLGERTRVVDGQEITLSQAPWSSSLGLGASVQLFDGGQRILELRQARVRVGAAAVNETSQRYAVALSAKQAFFDVLAARESGDAARAQLEQAEQQHHVSLARVRARVATRSDSLRAEIQLRAARLAVLDAQNSLQSADASLTRAIGSMEPVTAAPDSVTALPITLDDGALRALVENGPVVQQAQAAVQVARAGRLGAWTGYLPSVTASYSRSGSGTGDRPSLGGDDFTYGGSLRLSLSLPIFNQLQREQQVTQARVEEDNAEASLRDARLAALESLTRTLGAFRSADERVASQAATVEAAVEDLRVQQQRYAAGGSTLLDVLTSQTQLDQARRDLIRARYDQRVARAELEALVARDL